MMTTQGAFGGFQTLWPLYIAALGASPSQVGLVIGLVEAMRLGALLPVGVLGERFAPKWVITGGLLLKVLALVLYALAGTWWQLLPAGFLFAVGAIFPAILAEIAAVAGDGPERVRTFTLMNTVAPAIGLLIAPAIAGLIAARASLHGVFLFAALLTAAAAGLFATLAPRPPAPAQPVAVTYRSTLAQQAIRRWLLLEMAAVFALGLGITLIPNYLHDYQGVSNGAIGFFASLSAAGSIVLGLLVHRVPALRQPVRGVTLALGASALALLLVLAGQSLPAFVAAYVLIGGFFATWTLFEAVLSGVTPAAYRARTYALAELMSGAGISLAPFIAGVLYERDPRAPVLAGLVCIVTLVAAMFAMDRRGALPASHLPEEAT